MSWIILIIAGAFEVVGVTGIQMISHGQRAIGTATTAAGFVISFGLLSVAMNVLPLGIAYAVWAGIGTIGSALVGLVFYQESADRIRLFYILLVVTAIIGLRIVSS